MPTGDYMSVPDLAAAIEPRARDSRRYVVGITGPPAAGKSTLATRLADVLTAARVAPMDGFHLPSAALHRAGMLARKGQPDTFDVAGFLARSARLRHSPVGMPVPWPAYDRRLHDPVPDAIVFDEHRVAIVEGNYLLLDRPGWRELRTLLDEVWYVDADEALLEQRLLRRHLNGGKSAERAVAMVADSDLPNARVIAQTRSRAELVLRERGADYVIA